MSDDTHTSGLEKTIAEVRAQKREAIEARDAALAQVTEEKARYTLREQEFTTLQAAHDGLVEKVSAFGTVGAQLETQNQRVAELEAKLTGATSAAERSLLMADKHHLDADGREFFAGKYSRLPEDQRGDFAEFLAGQTDSPVYKAARYSFGTPSAVSAEPAAPSPAPVAGEPVPAPAPAAPSRQAGRGDPANAGAAPNGRVPVLTEYNRDKAAFAKKHGVKLNNPERFSP